MPDPKLDPATKMKSVRIAVEGCCHGQLDKIYKSVPKNVELLIICGDFQAIRNQQDLKSLNVPEKYLEMGDFKDYYSGEKKAPVLTIFIGGNHESSLYMRELQYGGWVAPGIYYLGEYGTVWYKGIRILGISGIHNHSSYVAAKSANPPKYTLPYGGSTIRSIYHVKPKNFLKLLLSGYSEIVLSHDWPKGVWEWGNKGRLLKKKPFLKADMESGRLGLPLAAEAMSYLRPANWFSLHMHTFFDAKVKHKSLGREVVLKSGDDIEVKRRRLDGEGVAESAAKTDANEISLDMDDMDDTGEETVENGAKRNEGGNQNEISLDMDDMDDLEGTQTGEKNTHGKSATLTVADSGENSGQEAKTGAPDSNTRAPKHAPETYFMALDKCLPRRDFLSVRFITPDESHPSFKFDSLYYDARGIAINKVVEEFVRSPSWALVSVHDMCKPERIADLLGELNERVIFESSKLADDFEVPSNWMPVAPDVNTPDVPLQYWPNNQTKEYCEKWAVPEPDLEGQ